MFSNALERCFYNKTRAFLTFLVLQHPAQELKSSFRANSRVLCVFVFHIRPENWYFSVFCKIVVSGARTTTFRCFVRLWFRRDVFVMLPTSGPRTRTFRCFVRLWFCPGVFAVVFGVILVLFGCQQHPAQELKSPLVWWCFCGGVLVALTHRVLTHRAHT